MTHDESRQSRAGAGGECVVRRCVSSWQRPHRRREEVLHILIGGTVGRNQQTPHFHDRAVLGGGRQDRADRPVTRRREPRAVLGAHRRRDARGDHAPRRSRRKPVRQCGRKPERLWRWCWRWSWRRARRLGWRARRCRGWHSKLKQHAVYSCCSHGDRLLHDFLGR